MMEPRKEQADDALPLWTRRSALVSDISAGDYCRAEDHDCGACSCDEIVALLQRAWGLES